MGGGFHPHPHLRHHWGLQDSRPNGGSNQRIIMFASEAMLGQLSACNDWAFDGTFQTAPVPYYNDVNRGQLFSVCGRVHGKLGR